MATPKANLSLASPKAGAGGQCPVCRANYVSKRIGNTLKFKWYCRRCQDMAQPGSPCHLIRNETYDKIRQHRKEMQL